MSGPSSSHRFSATGLTGLVQMTREASLHPVALMQHSIRPQASRRSRRTDGSHDRVRLAYVRTRAPPATERVNCAELAASAVYRLAQRGHHARGDGKKEL